VSVASAPVRTVLFAIVYLAATIAGRLTIMDGTSLSMVWPAAGVGVVWLAAQWHTRTRWADVAALSAITWGVNVATGASAGLAAAFIVANLVQAGVCLSLVRRWRPLLWGAGGAQPMRSPRDLWALLAAAFTATVSGAAIGPTAVWLFTGHYSWPGTAVWLARNTASMLLIGAVGLCFGHAVMAFRQRHGSLFRWPRHAVAALAATPRRRLAEYLALAVCSIAAYLAGFALNHGLPIAFTLIGLTVWAATRLATPFVVLHDLAVGVIVVLFTLHHDGPFALVGSDAVRAFLAQLFVATVAVVGLALALGRDERAALLDELAREKAVLAAAKEDETRRAGLMSAIIDSMADGLSVIDADGRVVLRNPAAAHLFGGQVSPGGKVAGSSHYGLYHPSGGLLTPDEMPVRRAMTGDTSGMDVVVRNPGVPEGRILHVKTTVLTEADGARSAVLLYTDVTAERRQRDDLAGFAGVVAHDLLNPLSAVQGWTTTAADALADAPDHPQVAQALAGLVRVDRAATRMRHLINDLLSYATSRDAAINPAPVDLAAMVTDIATARTDAAVAAGTVVPRFTVGHLDDVRADPVLTRQLLDNLIGNAIKYTAPGVVPHITVASAEDDGEVRVSVTDNGIGIPAGQHAAIFGDFHRAHRDHGYAGTGLGLAICRRIVERHGGTITATDDPAGGTRFTFTLPADLEAARPALATH
jgi:signal transduction histidine kinase